MTYFFPTKALQHQKRYLQRALFNFQDYKVCEFICRVNDMVEYLKQYPTVG